MPHSASSRAYHRSLTSPPHRHGEGDGVGTENVSAKREYDPYGSRIATLNAGGSTGTYERANPNPRFDYGDELNVTLATPLREPRGALQRAAALTAATSAAAELSAAAARAVSAGAGTRAGISSRVPAHLLDDGSSGRMFQLLRSQRAGPAATLGLAGAANAPSAPAASVYSAAGGTGVGMRLGGGGGAPGEHEHMARLLLERDTVSVSQ